MFIPSWIVLLVLLHFFFKPSAPAPKSPPIDWAKELREWKDIFTWPKFPAPVTDEEMSARIRSDCACARMRVETNWK